MAKVQKEYSKTSFSKDYQKLMKSFPNTNSPQSEPQWASKGDFFVKFSLYQNIPSIASTETSLLQ